jgi:PAS domain S-box-containing protein
MVTRSTGDLFAQIVEGASEGIWVIDLDGQTLYANATMAGLLHYTADELAGLSMLDTLDAVGREQAAVVFQRDRDRQGVVLEQVQSMFVRHDGRPCGAWSTGARCATPTATTSGPST